MRAIDADAMLARLEEWNTDDPTDKALYNFAWNRIIEQPTIEPERKKGKWIIHGEPSIYLKECSACGEKSFHHQGQGLTPYCSNCGADMREEQDG